MPGQDLAAFLQHGARREHRARAKAASLEHGRAHADQRALLDHASLELSRVTDARVLLDQGRQALGAVNDHVVLDVGALAHLDGRLIAAQHRAKPDAGAGRDLHVADQDGGRCDVGVGMHSGAPPGKLEFHRSL